MPHLSQLTLDVVVSNEKTKQSSSVPLQEVIDSDNDNNNNNNKQDPYDMTTPLINIIQKNKLRQLVLGTFPKFDMAPFCEILQYNTSLQVLQVPMGSDIRGNARSVDTSSATATATATATDNAFARDMHSLNPTNSNSNNDSDSDDDDDDDASNNNSNSNNTGNTSNKVNKMTDEQLLAHVLRRHNTTLFQVATSHEQIAYYATLNACGRTLARHVDTTKSQFVGLLQAVAMVNVISDDRKQVIQYGLLRESPNHWCLPEDSSSSSSTSGRRNSGTIKRKRSPEEDAGKDLCIE
jgi:hypothetical protein